jgi:hypothetical protein
MRNVDSFKKLKTKKDKDLSVHSESDRERLIFAIPNQLMKKGLTPAEIESIVYEAGQTCKPPVSEKVIQEVLDKRPPTMSSMEPSTETASDSCAENDKENFFSWMLELSIGIDFRGIEGESARAEHKGETKCT